MQRWQNEMKHANVDHAGDIGSKTKPWPAPGLRSIFLAVLLRLPRWGPGAIATGILARCQEYTKRMPSGCQGNAKGMPSACHEGCQEDAMWGIFRTYINAGGNTRVFPPLWRAAADKQAGTQVALHAGHGMDTWTQRLHRRQ